MMKFPIYGKMTFMFQTTNQCRLMSHEKIKKPSICRRFSQISSYQPPFSTMWSPRSIAKLVYKSYGPRLCGRYIELVIGDYKPTYNWLVVDLPL